MTDKGTAITELLAQVKELARKYYCLTGKPLGVTGEIGEYEAAHILGLTLAEARTVGHDATDSSGIRYEIKSRYLPRIKKFGGQRIGQIGPHDNWDKLLVVLLDEQYDAFAIYEADKDKVLAALDRPGSVSRNKRRALDIPTVQKIGRVKWEK